MRPLNDRFKAYGQIISRNKVTKDGSFQWFLEFWHFTKLMEFPVAFLQKLVEFIAACPLNHYILLPSLYLVAPRLTLKIYQSTELPLVLGMNFFSLVYLNAWMPTSLISNILKPWKLIINGNNGRRYVLLYNIWDFLDWKNGRKKVSNIFCMLC